MAKTTKQTPAAVPEPARIKVEATALGYAGDRRRRPGDVFWIPESHFSAAWMTRVPDTTPERTMSPADFARRRQAQITIPRMNPIGMNLEPDDDEEPRAATPTGAQSVI